MQNGLGDRLSRFLLFYEEEVFAQEFYLGKYGNEQDTAAYAGDLQEQCLEHRIPAGKLHGTTQKYHNNDVQEVDAEGNAGQIADGLMHTLENAVASTDPFQCEGGADQKGGEDIVHIEVRGTSVRVKLITAGQQKYAHGGEAHPYSFDF